MKCSDSAMQMTQTTLVHGIYGITMRLENMILVQLKIEERQAVEACHLDSNKLATLSLILAK